MPLTGGIEITEEERRTNPIYPIPASSFVLLASQGRHISHVHGKLRSLMDDFQYNIRGHNFRPALDYPRGRSEQFDDFVALLISGRHMFQSSVVQFTEAGAAFCKRRVLEYFVEDPELTVRFAKDAGLDLYPLLRKYVGKYLEITEPK